MSEVGVVDGVQSKDGSRVESEAELTSSGTPDGVDDPERGLRSLAEYEGKRVDREENDDEDAMPSKSTRGAGCRGSRPEGSGELNRK